jgi:hypothetical protein
MMSGNDRSKIKAQSKRKNKFYEHIFTLELDRNSILNILLLIRSEKNSIY